MSPTVRLDDVAAAAGVSVATASRALSGKNRVSAATIAHVRATAERLGYRVDPIARALREGSTRTVGMVVPVIGNPFYAELVDAVEDALQEQGLELILADSHGDVEHEARRLDLLTARRVDGVIVVPSDYTRSAPAIESAQRHVPVVQLDRRVNRLATDFVGVDNSTGIELVFDHLESTGVSTIAFVSSDDVTSAGRERREAYERALPESRFQAHKPVFGDFSISTGRMAATELLSRGTLPDAVIAGSDLIAFGLISGLRDAGIRTPSGMLVTGFDGTLLSDIYDPGLTTVIQPLSAMAAEAARFLVSRIDATDTAVRSSRIAPTLAIRQSTRP